MVRYTDDGTIEKYVYGNGLIASYETYEEAGTYDFDIVINGVEPVSKTEYHSFFYDIRGSVTIVTDEAGTVTAEYSYSTYGKRTTISGNDSSVLGYCARDGVLTDANGLLYMRARYYYPDLMRFINQDIVTGDISNSSSLNRYAYVNGNPVTLIDPFGLCAERAWKAICGTANMAKGSVFTLLSGFGLEAGMSFIVAGGPLGWVFGGAICLLSLAELYCGEADIIVGSQQIAGAIFNDTRDVYHPIKDKYFNGDTDRYTIAECSLGCSILALAELGNIINSWWGNRGVKSTCNTAPGSSSQAGKAQGGSETVRVGRWMSQEEYDKMTETGKVQMSPNGNTTYVANPADIEAFGKQAKPGSIYVEFDVDANSVYPAGNDGWGQIAGPGSMYDRLNIKRGLPSITEMPDANNITVRGKK